MGEAAVMVQAECAAAEAAEHIEIGGFCRESQRRGSERGLAVESGAAHVGAKQKMGYRFHEPSEV